MTNDEAIKELSEWVAYAESIELDEEMPEYVAAMKMAIKALKEMEKHENEILQLK